MRTAFVILAFAYQVILLADFSARKWRPELEKRWGWLVYGALGIAGFILTVLMLLSKQPVNLIIGPLLLFAWAAFGFGVDWFRPIEWRSPPRWPIFIPYVLLFIFSQFGFWIPLWYVALGTWIVFGVLYAANTILNISSHGTVKSS